MANKTDRTPSVHRVTMNLKKAYLILTVSIVLSLVLLLLLYGLVHDPGVNGKLVIQIDLLDIILFLAVLFMLSAAHEWTHAAGFVYIGGASWKEVSFGVIWKAMTPYAHCRKGISAGAYKISGILPIVYGIVPLAAGLIRGSWMLYGIGMIMFLASYGDLLLLWMLRKVPNDAIVKDLPEQLGCEIIGSDGNE